MSKATTTCTTQGWDCWNLVWVVMHPLHLSELGPNNPHSKHGHGRGGGNFVSVVTITLGTNAKVYQFFYKRKNLQCAYVPSRLWLATTYQQQQQSSLLNLPMGLGVSQRTTIGVYYYQQQRTRYRYVRSVTEEPNVRCQGPTWWTPGGPQVRGPFLLSPGSCYVY